MSPTRTDSPPLGVKVIAVWAAITGVALLVLGVAGTPLYLPLGAGALAAAYGLWTRRPWALPLAVAVLAVEGVQDVVAGELTELGIVLLMAGYLYSQRHHFPAPGVPA